MANRPKWTSQKKGRFLSELRKNPNVTLAAKTIGMSRCMMYVYRDEDEGFKKEWDEAIEEGLDLMEEEVRRRAYDGVNELVFYQGKKCGSVQKYSDTLLMFLLKRYRPEFRDSVKIDGALDVRNLTDEQLNAKIADFLAKAGVSLAPGGTGSAPKSA